MRVNGFRYLAVLSYHDSTVCGPGPASLLYIHITICKQTPGQSNNVCFSFPFYLNINIAQFKDNSKVNITYD